MTARSVLVTGGSGFIGTNLVKELLRRGHSVRASYHHRPIQVEDPRIEYVQADLRDPTQCAALARDRDEVYMCAGATFGAKVMDQRPLALVTPNIVMNSQMLEAAYEANVQKFVYLSSSTLYPPMDDHPITEDEAWDGDPYPKYYPVGWMKRYTEILCKIYSQKIKRPMSTVVVRPSNIYGPYDDFDFETSHMLPALIRRTVERTNPFVVWGKGEDIKDLIYIDDFIEGLLLAAEKKDTYDPINIAYGQGYNIKDIIKMILEIDGFDDAQIKFDTSKPTMIPVRLLNTEKAKRELGFKPKITLEEGIRRTIAWYRKEVSNPKAANYSPQK